jgi:tetratricopeptide (TPR) repeat protein
MSTGTPAEAARAVRDPEADRATLRAIHALTQRGAIPEAVVRAQAALALGLEHAFLLNLAALGAEEAGRLQEATELLVRARALEPGNLGTHNALGLVRQRSEQHAQAIQDFDAALRIDPRFAPAHFNRGASLEALRRLAAAAEAYQAALALDPVHAPSLAGLASLEARRGGYAEALRLAQAALTLAPNFVLARIALAGAAIGRGEYERARAELAAVIAMPEARELERARAEGLLGDALDGLDRRDEAMAAYTAANERLRRHYAERFSTGQSALDYALALDAYFARTDVGAWARKSSAGRAPAGLRGHVFLMGFPRSGTTLLEQVLASHPKVSTLEERETLLEPLRAYMRRPEDLGRLLVADARELELHREHYWAEVRGEGITLEGRIFVDKYPLNTLKLPLIARLFPEARILFAIRDPRDVVFSCFRRQFAMSAPMYQLLTLDGAAGFYAASFAFAKRALPLLGLATHVVRHEHLVENFDAEARSVCAFLGLEWHEGMRGFAARSRDRDVATPSAAQLASGLSGEGIGQWRRYEAQIGAAFAALAPWVETLRYGDGATPTRPGATFLAPAGSPTS